MQFLLSLELFRMKRMSSNRWNILYEKYCCIFFYKTCFVKVKINLDIILSEITFNNGVVKILVTCFLNTLHIKVKTNKKLTVQEPGFKDTDVSRQVAVCESFNDLWKQFAETYTVCKRRQKIIHAEFIPLSFKSSTRHGIYIGEYSLEVIHWLY